MFEQEIADVLAIDSKAPDCLVRIARFTRPDADPLPVTRSGLGAIMGVLRRHRFPAGYSIETVGAGQ
jgi:hypothetical protein